MTTPQFLINFLDINILNNMDSIPITKLLSVSKNQTSAIKTSAKYALPSQSTDMQNNEDLLVESRLPCDSDSDTGMNIVLLPGSNTHNFSAMVRQTNLQKNNWPHTQLRTNDFINNLSSKNWTKMDDVYSKHLLNPQKNNSLSTC